MKRSGFLVTGMALLTFAGSAAAQQTQTQSQTGGKQTQTQSQTGGKQTQTQNNGTIYQSQYQVNDVKGAAQGSGTGLNQAEADYNASASTRKATPEPQGSKQTQKQTLLPNKGYQDSNTKPRSSSSSNRVSPQ